MKTWTLCDPETGLFTGAVVRCSHDQLAANTERDRRQLLPIAGHFDHRSQRFDLAAAAKATPGDHSMPADFVVEHQQPTPSPDYEWVAENQDAPTRAGQRWRWKKKPEAAQRELDEQRARQFIAGLEAAERVKDRLPPAERATLQRFLASSAPSAPAPAAPAEPPAE